MNYKPLKSEQPVIPSWKKPFLLAHSHLWNLWRRPQVKRWQAELLQIADAIKTDLSTTLLPELYDKMRAGCQVCAFHYSFLKSQPFTSQIELALTKQACLNHIEAYMLFHELHEQMFDRSHELSDLICGFKSNRK
jgi:hypothetical protein